jgi:hypothetical protein
VTRTPLVRLASLAAGAAMIGGCASAQPPAVDRPAASGAAADILLQTPRYEAGARLVERARGVLVRRCMAERGFDYDASVAPAPPAPSLPRSGAGYGVYERVRATPVPRSRPGAQTPAYRRALDGTDAQRATVRPPDGLELSYRTGGCDARAIAALHGSLADYYTAVARRNAVVMRTLGRMHDDVRLERATTGWQACMRERGRRFESPAQAREAVLARYARSSRIARVRTIETRIAADDRECGLRSAVYGEQRRSARAIVAAVGARDVAVLEQLARSRSAVTARARDVIRR